MAQMVVRTGPGSRGRNIHRGNLAACGKAVAFPDRGVAFRPAADVGHRCSSQYRSHPPVGVLPVVGPSHGFRTFETEHRIRLQSLALVPGGADIRGPVQPHGIYDIFLPRSAFPCRFMGNRCRRVRDNRGRGVGIEKTFSGHQRMYNKCR